MKLEEYLRQDFAKYIRPLFIKNNCEVCGITDNLELHHIKQFAEVLSDTLELLNLPNKAIQLYTSDELNKIKYIILGKQISSKYMILCNKCHDKIIPRRYKPNIIKAILKNDVDITSMTFNRCMNPKNAMKELQEDFLNNNITLEELIIESMGIGYLHPSLYGLDNGFNIDFTGIEEIDKEEMDVNQR